MTDSNERAFPNVLAIDPEDCGCTECIVGEYVPQRYWTARATIADVQAFIRGEISDHTYSSHEDTSIAQMTVDIYHEYNNSETREWLENLNNEVRGDHAMRDAMSRID